MNSNERDYDIFLEIKCKESILKKVTQLLKDSLPKSNVTLLESKDNSSLSKENIWMPESIWDLDFCNHLNINYEPDIDSRHPGFSDMGYRKRRQEIADIAFVFRHGDKIPYVTYTDDEVK